MRTLQPVFLLHLVSYFEHSSNTTRKEGYLNAMGLMIVSLLSVLFHQLYFFSAHRTGMRLRIAATGVIYRKVSQLRELSQYMLYMPIVTIGNHFSYSCFVHFLVKNKCI